MIINLGKSFMTRSSTLMPPANNPKEQRKSPRENHKPKKQQTQPPQLTPGNKCKKHFKKVKLQTNMEKFLKR